MLWSSKISLESKVLSQDFQAKSFSRDRILRRNRILFMIRSFTTSINEHEIRFLHDYEPWPTYTFSFSYEKVISVWIILFQIKDSRLLTDARILSARTVYIQSGSYILHDRILCNQIDYKSMTDTMDRPPHGRFRTRDHGYLL